MDYPFDKPERWRRFYKSHIRCYRKRGFWNKVTWDIAQTVLAYVYAALTLDNPTATASDGELLLTLIRKDDDDYDYKENIERKRYLFKSIPEVLSIGRREDLKRLLRLCLRWYKKAPIRLKISPNLIGLTVLLNARAMKMILLYGYFGVKSLRCSGGNRWFYLLS